MTNEIYTHGRVIHPGRYIKESVLPEGLSVKDAAKMLGVGRPALSNLLNENASLSPEMAVRIEKAFGAKRDDLLKLQADYDDFQMRAREKNIAVRVYARSAVVIHAKDIDDWSERIESRSLLPAFLRKLVSTTGKNLSKVDFPAYDNSQRKGWDGQVETDTATPWIPSGKSGWEFGCNENPQQKAEKDYQARMRSTSVNERSATTFVFVTPKNWPGKDVWAEKKAALGEWKAIKAFDASDLEQWLEQSVAAQCWFAAQIGFASNELLSLDQCWTRWASATTPVLNKEMFRDSVESCTDRLRQWLRQPPSEPLIVTATSEDEALSCLVCLFENLEDLAYFDRAVIVRSVNAFDTAGKALPNFIAIVTSSEVEKILAGFQKKQHTIIVRSHAIYDDNIIAVDLPSHETFKASLKLMGFDEDGVERYVRESGYSPTILRRRLSPVPAIKSPPWTQVKEIVRKVIPMVLAGVWKADSPADQEILRTLSNVNYPEIERAVADILQSDQSLLWSLDKYRGVTSKIDALFAISPSLTREDLDNFFFVAKYVLREDDPALDFPEDKRWAAKLYGKSRDHSSAIRKGLCETLVLLAVNGNNLFQERLGLNVEAQVNSVIRELLNPLGPKTWLSQQHDLPRYAEAAPDEFLRILEDDLKTNDPTIYSLLRPAGSGVFGGCPRSGLLWALELLAWKPERLVRAASILAKLSELRIDDNWGNKPENSLASIFRPWMPQTAAPIEQRKATMEILARIYPTVGWSLCVDQFDPGSTVGHYNNRPQWRNDASGAGQPIFGEEDYQSRRKALDIALDWPTHNENTLGDLVQRLQGISEKDQERIWNLIVSWNACGPTDQQKAVLRERIRRCAFTRRGRNRKLGKKTKDRAREIYELLKPENVIARHKWLFAQNWVEESAEEIEDEEFDYKKREERIGKLRAEALRDIWVQRGFDGIRELCEAGDAAGAIGWHLAESIIEKGKAAEFLHQAVSSRFGNDADVKLGGCIAGFLVKLDDSERCIIVSKLIKGFITQGTSGTDNIIRLCKCAPFRAETWSHIDKLDERFRKKYWSEVNPRWDRYEASELNKFIDELMAVNRPRAAFAGAHLSWKEVEGERLIRLLREVATNNSEPAGHYRFSEHDISSAFESLDTRTDISKDQLVQLEFIFVQVLEHTKHGIPNIEREFAKSPQLFMQALALTYKRSDKGQDPPEWTVREEQQQAACQTTYALLKNVKRIPGTLEDGTIDKEKLASWLAEARTLCETYARKEVGDHAIGKILSSCPIGADGIWPCEPVRQALEEIASNDIAEGMRIGVYNSRGVTWRGKGGDQERDLAKKYRNWSKQVAFEFPYIANMLEDIARSYDHDAEWHDTDDKIRKRLEH